MKRWRQFLCILAAALLLGPAVGAGETSASPQPLHRLRKRSPHFSAVSASSKHWSASKFRSGSSRRSRSRRRRSRRRGQKAPLPDRIAEIQSVLARGGYYQGEPTGKWDAPTVEAMKQFQQARGLNPTGKIDALTLQKLGLGSDIAGVGAPRPTPPPTPQSESMRR